jgi:hypothetical protein
MDAELSRYSLLRKSKVSSEGLLKNIHLSRRTQVITVCLRKVCVCEIADFDHRVALVIS